MVVLPYANEAKPSYEDVMVGSGILNIQCRMEYPLIIFPTTRYYYVDNGFARNKFPIDRITSIVIDDDNTPVTDYTFDPTVPTVIRFNERIDDWIRVTGWFGYGHPVPAQDTDTFGVYRRIVGDEYEVMVNDGTTLRRAVFGSEVTGGLLEKIMVSETMNWVTTTIAQRAARSPQARQAAEMNYQYDGSRNVRRTYGLQRYINEWRRDD